MRYLFVEEVIPINIGQNIRYLRLQRNMTQREFAQSLCVSVAAISRWENEVCYPDITLLPTIAKLLNTSIDSLFFNQVVNETIHNEVYERRIRKPYVMVQPVRAVSDL